MPESLEGIPLTVTLVLNSSHFTSFLSRVCSHVAFASSLTAHQNRLCIKSVRLFVSPVLTRPVCQEAHLSQGLLERPLSGFAASLTQKWHLVIRIPFAGMFSHITVNLHLYPLLTPCCYFMVATYLLSKNIVNRLPFFCSLKVSPLYHSRGWLTNWIKHLRLVHKPRDAIKGGGV